MMNHANGWMNGWMGGGGSMWVWPAFGVLIVALLVVVVMKQSKR